jgi:hypothetical protein
MRSSTLALTLSSSDWSVAGQTQRHRVHRPAEEVLGRESSIDGGLGVRGKLLGPEGNGDAGIVPCGRVPRIARFLIVKTLGRSYKSALSKHHTLAEHA